MARIVSLIAVSMALLGTASSTTGHPEDVHIVQVVAKKFAFEPAVIQVTAGEPVILVVRSADAVHGFQIRELHLDIQVPRGGEAITVSFTAPPPGRYEIACSEFCGSGHGQMKAVLESIARAHTSS